MKIKAHICPNGINKLEGGFFLDAQKLQELGTVTDLLTDDKILYLGYLAAKQKNGF